MGRPQTDYYLIRLGRRDIGAIRVVRMEGDQCRISPLFLLPEFQGFAQQAIRAAEERYPRAAWSLEIIKEEEKLCHLYEKMGYRPTGREEAVQPGMTIVYYEK